MSAVDFALNNRLVIVALALVLFIWGAVSFHQLPVEAYPDVADNYVEIITQWPGISAEQIEQQVTVPLENGMNGIPHLVHLRSFSLFGLSDIKLIFDDESDNDWNRERSAGAAFQVTLPNGVSTADGNRLEPGRSNLFLHSAQHQSAIRPDGIEVTRRLGGRKELQSCAERVDVASFGGPTREYQVRVDPNKLIAYGLSIGQVEQQLTTITPTPAEASSKPAAADQRKRSWPGGASSRY